MVLSKRERNIFLAAATVLAVLVLKQMVISPILRARDSSRQERAQLESQLVAAKHTLAAQKRLTPMWQEMQPSLPAAAAAAESQILHTVNNAADQAGLSLTLVRPERVIEGGRMPQITFQAVCGGSMAKVSRFLFLLESAPVPIRLTELQLAGRKDGLDDLTAEVRFSTLSRLSGKPMVKVAPAAKKTAEEVE